MKQPLYRNVVNIPMLYPGTNSCSDVSIME